MGWRCGHAGTPGGGALAGPLGRLNPRSRARNCRLARGVEGEERGRTAGARVVSGNIPVVVARDLVTKR